MRDHQGRWPLQACIAAMTACLVTAASSAAAAAQPVEGTTAVARVDDVLTTGEVLRPGDSLTSPTGRSSLILTDDRSLVAELPLTLSAGPAVDSVNLASMVSLLILQDDGNLVAYGAANEVRWQSGTHGSPVRAVRVQDDRNVILTDEHGRVVTDLATYRRSRLGVGSELLPGDTVPSPDLRGRLTMQEDGNLVLTRDGVPLWSSLTFGNPGATALVRYNEATDPAAENRELVVLSATGDVLFRMIRGRGFYVGYPSAFQVLVKDTALSFSSAGGYPVRGYLPTSVEWGTDWESDRLRPGDVMLLGDRRVSSGGRCILLRQRDTNLVLLCDGVPVWSTGLSLRGPEPEQVTVMQADGNLVSYWTRTGESWQTWAERPNRVAWSSGTSVPGSSTLVQDDGNVVVVGPEDRPVWSRLTGPVR